MMKMMILAALAQIPYHDGKEERRDEGRDAHADCLLCWLAEGLDGVPYGQRSLRR